MEEGWLAGLEATMTTTETIIINSHHHHQQHLGRRRLELS